MNSATCPSRPKQQATSSRSSRALGRRSRGEDHREAAVLLDQIVPDGKEAAKALIALIDVKDTAHYGLIHVTRRQLTIVLRRGRKLVDFAEDVLRR
jgi:hypothetical protein